MTLIIMVPFLLRIGGSVMWWDSLVKGSNPGAGYLIGGLYFTLIWWVRDCVFGLLHKRALYLGAIVTLLAMTDVCATLVPATVKHFCYTNYIFLKFNDYKGNDYIEQLYCRIQCCECIPM